MRNVNSLAGQLLSAALLIVAFALCGCDITRNGHTITFTSTLTIGFGEQPGSEVHAQLPVHGSIHWHADIDGQSPHVARIVHTRTCTRERC